MARCYDYDAHIVDMRIDPKDDGFTEAAVIHSLLHGDAGLPDGPYPPVSIKDPVAFIEDDEIPGTPIYRVIGLDATSRLVCSLHLFDWTGAFATIPMGGLTYEQIRSRAHRAAADRFGSGPWKLSFAIQGRGRIQAMLVNGDRSDEGAVTRFAEIMQEQRDAATPPPPPPILHFPDLINRVPDAEPEYRTLADAIAAM